jgi:hypothetical protein
MANAPVKRRNRDWVLLTQFLFLDAAPKSLNLRQNSLDYVGAAPSRKHVTGVYGTNSRDTALFLASSWADAHGKLLMLLDTWVHMPNFQQTRLQITREIVKESKWLHTDRLSSSLKEEIHAKMLKWIMKAKSNQEAAEAIDMTVSALMLKYPELAMRLLDEDADIGMLIHPVYAKFDTSEEKVPFWAATIHTDRIEIAACEVRHAPEIKVEY